MAQRQTTICDQCDADITQGNGRQWRLMVVSEVIGMKPGSAPRQDAGTILQPQHFCDEKCLQAWAATQAAAKDQAQDQFEAQQQAAADAAAAKERAVAAASAASESSSDTASAPAVQPEGTEP